MNSRNLQKVIELRHTLHTHPELSLHERMTLNTIKQFLTQNTTLQIVDRDGWLYAVKEGAYKAAGSIAFRADMDALPIKETIALPYASECDGISHKCGHDGHSAVLCGLALELDAISVSRTVYLIFQPAEEIGAGGEMCSRLIKENNIEEVYAFHNLSGYPEGSIVYRNGLTQPASEGLTIRLLGRESHASAPEEGINPSAAISKIALYSEDLLLKKYKGMALCTIVGITAGTGDFGISAKNGEIKMTLRAEYEDEMKTMEESLKKYTLRLADKYGLKAEFSISDYFPETRNDDECVKRVIEAANSKGFTVRQMDKLWRASEDFGYYTKQCRGAMFYIGNGENYPPLHTAEYDFNDKIITVAVDIFTELAMNG